jgi:small subunit ribosomal protein S2
MSVVSMRQLLEAGVHFGHQTRRWNPKMRRFIFSERNGIYIIDIQQTIGMLEAAHAFVRDAVARGGSVLFVGTKKQAQEAIEQQAQRVGMPYVNYRWLGGMLTNFETIRTRLTRLKELEDMARDGTFELLPKKEALHLQREREKLQRNLGGIRSMTKLPAAVWIVDTVKEHIAVNEANRLGIPVVAVVDTNCDPDVIDYVIPGNDDAIRSGALLTRIVADAVAEGHQLRASRSTEEVVAEQAAAVEAAPVATPAAEPLAEWEIALQQEEAARQAAQASALGISRPARPAPEGEAARPAPEGEAARPAPEGEAARPAPEGEATSEDAARRAAVAEPGDAANFETTREEGLSGVPTEPRPDATPRSGEDKAAQESEGEPPR